MRRTSSTTLLVCLAALLSIALPVSTSRAAEIRGTITDAETGAPLPATTVQALIDDATEVARTVTDADGNYRLADLTERSFTLVFSRLSYAGQTVADVWASRLGEAVLNVSLVSSPLSLDGIVVTASRLEERGLGAPASTSVIDRRTIEERPQLTPLDLTRSVTGVDFASKGMIQHNLSMRGNRWTMSISPLLLTDYRYAHVPLLNYTLPYMVPTGSDDIERIEVVRGPNSVLYGPDSAQGVIHVITRSPLDSPGTMVSVLGGTREMFQGTFRHSAVINDRFGLKLSGRWFSGHDWEYVDPVEERNRAAAIAGGADPDTLKIGNRDPYIRNATGEARLDWRLSPGTTLALTGGIAQAINHVDINHSLGGLQFKDWRTSFLQGRLMSGRFLANVFYNHSYTGDTYALRTGRPLTDNSRVTAAQLQHGAELAERMQLVYGVDARYTDPRTSNTIHGRNEDDDEVTELGAYVSTTTEVSSKWDLVAAARADYHDRIDDLAISPRLGAIFQPTPSQALRLTWNRAFNSPSAPEIFVDLFMGSVMPGMDIRLVGFPKDGYSFSRGCDGGLCMRSPLYASGPSTVLPTDATLMWPAVVQMMADQGVDLSGLPAPDAANVGTDLRRLDVQNGGFTETLDANEVLDASKVGRIISNTFELGYKGALGARAYLAVDVHRTHLDNYYGEIMALNPNVFLNEEDLSTYFETTGGLSSDEAAAAAAAAAGIPLGTVVPDGQETAEVLLVNMLGGSFTNWGVDLAAELSLSRRLHLTGNYSWLEKNIAVMPDVGDEVLSVPRNKAAIGLAYRDEAGGLDGNLQGRWVESYPLGSGVYEGQIETYIVIDVGVGYRFSWSPYVRWSVDALNVLDNRHQEWIGAPELGRLLMTRVQVNF